MKIAAKAIDGYLQTAKPYGGALFYGPDAGLVRDRAQTLRDAFLGKNYDPMALCEFEDAALLADHSKLTDEILAVSMMAPKRVIMIRDAGEKVAPIIREASASLHADTMLIVTASELTPRSGLRVFFEAEPSLAAVACYRDEMRDVQSVISKKLSEAGIAAERDTLDYLASQLGNDRYVTYQELDKIITYVGTDKRLTLESAQALVDYNRDTQLDDIVSAVADKNIAQLDAMLQVQLREAVQPIAYLRALQRYFNRLYLLRAQIASGMSMDVAIAGLKPKVFFKQEQTLRRHLSQWKSEAIIRALTLLSEAELACKTSDVPAIAASTRKLLQITQLR